MLNAPAHRFSEHTSASADAASSRTYLAYDRTSGHQRPPWAVIGPKSSRATLQKPFKSDVRSADLPSTGHRTALLADQPKQGSARVSLNIRAEQTYQEKGFNIDAFTQDMWSRSTRDAQFWTPEAGPWSLLCEKTPIPNGSIFTTSTPLRLDMYPSWDPDSEAASVATEMALQVLQSDDFNDACSSPQLEEGSDDSAPMSLTTPLSADSYDVWGYNTPSLPSPRSASFLASFHELRVSASDASTACQGGDVQNQDKESESDSPKKRGKARMSQEKRRRLARRKEREAMAAAQQEFHHLADPSQSWSPSRSLPGDTPRIRLSSSLPRATNWQATHRREAMPAPRSTATGRGDSAGDSSSSSSYGDRADSDGGPTVYSNGVQRAGSTSSASTGPPHTPITDTSSGMRLYSPRSAPLSCGAPGHVVPLAAPQEALNKVETLRALEHLTTQMLAAKKSNTSPIVPALQETTRNTWRPAYSFNTAQPPSNTQVTLPGRLPQHQTGFEAASSQGRHGSSYLSSSHHGRPSPPPTPASRLPIPVPMSYEQTAKLSHFDGRQEYGRSGNDFPFTQQGARESAFGVPAHLPHSGHNAVRAQPGDHRQRRSKTFDQRQQYGPSPSYQTSTESQYGHWQAQQWPM
ncbi:hypothetical protein BCV69DRAFT_48228 [Microstroma glucosiphilum]|uniref:Uncharacterized protein n=1 Tax=Pseudomicrostroma glucosiphilum TaxID=1684307 RepID=A0A316U1S7_9BASI|nr:hypothetical protein BCV69DRAFT_48228 [Pseudomicrostroma glucosiphilum]PWN19237.1 hypothetical protein BCV69DRAFT_48228 [Pseudomicrostroma glucosiphilum]